MIPCTALNALDALAVDGFAADDSTSEGVAAGYGYAVSGAHHEEATFQFKLHLAAQASAPICDVMRANHMKPEIQQAGLQVLASLTMIRCVHIQSVRPAVLLPPTRPFSL